ncbi:MAG: hypothetical protein O2931_13445 [Planctomycetota bacterium]|nr:hypothetical protein [Planctomycetota bacterium]MDA1179788.1 hypothetical protein [Planctomycetota bacterium]
MGVPLLDAAEQLTRRLGHPSRQALTSLNAGRTRMNEILYEFLCPNVLTVKMSGACAAVNLAEG